MDRDLYYNPELHAYFDTSTGEMFSFDEVERFDKEKREHRQSLEELPLFQLLNIYCDGCADGTEKGVKARKACYMAARRGLKAEKEAVELLLNDEVAYRRGIYRDTVNRLTGSEKTATQEFIDAGHKARMAMITARMKKVMFGIRYIDRLLKTERDRDKGIEAQPDDKDRITWLDIEAAKQVPIDTIFPGRLRKRDKRGTGLCPFHSDRLPSFVAYLDTNTWHCFAGCTGRDVIDFVQKQSGVDFLTAVKLLLHRP